MWNAESAAENLGCILDITKNELQFQFISARIPGRKSPRCLVQSGPWIYILMCKLVKFNEQGEIKAVTFSPYDAIETVTNMKGQIGKR